MRVLLATYGTRGDVEPVLALAVRLRELGVDVRMCVPANEEFARLLAREGVPGVSFDEPGGSGTAGSTTARERVEDVDAFVGAHIDATYDVLVEAARGCDLMLASGMLHFVAGSVAEKAGVPHRFVVFAPVLDVPRRDALVGPAINAHRSSIGLPPVEDVRAFLFTDRPWVAMDPVLDPWRGSAGLDVVRTPAWVLPDERPLPDALAEFLGAGAPPVYVGFGSARVARDSIGAAVEAVRSTGHRVLASRGWSDLPALEERGEVLVVGEVSHQVLFARVAAAVHHGGAGTTATAARAGVPQVVVPQGADQSYWAQRVGDLGIGAAHEGPTPTHASLSAALGTALDPATIARAREVAAAIRTDGTEVAARLLLDAVG